MLSKNTKQQKRSRYRKLQFQPLEARLALAASVGWDGPGLGNAQLTYNIANNPNSLSMAETTATIEKALSVWSSVAKISFTPTSQKGLRDSLDISFTNIDGPSRTLAQAYFPDDVNSARIAGDVQFDSSETWEIGNSQGSRAFDLLWVAVHEIGHALGLDHVSGNGSVLAPYVSPSQQFVSLSATDINAIRSIYASAGSTTTTTSNPTTTPTNTPTTNTTNTGDSDNNPFPRFRWRHGGNWRRFGGRLETEGSFSHNVYNPTDVNGDSITSPVDVLQVINYLRRPTSAEGEDTPMCDTNGDGEVSPIDVLTVINALSSQARLGTQSTTSSNDSGPTSGDSEDETDTSDDSVDCENEVANSSNLHVASSSFVYFALHGKTAEKLFDRYDDDDNGSLVETEVPERLWNLFVDMKVDTDANDAVSLAELQAAIAAARKEYFDGQDDNADGSLTESEVSARFWRKVSTADSNDDNAVSFDEFNVWLNTRASNDPGYGHRHGHHRGVHLANNLVFSGKSAEDVLDRYDADENGSLIEDEVPARLWKLFVDKGVDTDANAAISLVELQAAITAARKELFNSKDTNTDGSLTEVEVGERVWAKISTADTNADNLVSFDEFNLWLDEAPVRGHPHIRTDPGIVDAVFAQVGASISRLRRFR